MKNLIHFLVTPIVFPTKTRKHIASYLLAMFAAFCLLEIYLTLTSGFSFKSGILLATIMLIFMPFIIYFSYALNRTIKVVTKKQKKDTERKYWLFSRMFFHLMAIILTYTWLAILLLAAAMCVVAG